MEWGISIIHRWEWSFLHILHRKQLIMKITCFIKYNLWSIACWKKEKRKMNVKKLKKNKKDVYKRQAEDRSSMWWMAVWSDSSMMWNLIHARMWFIPYLSIPRSPLWKSCFPGSSRVMKSRFPRRKSKISRVMLFLWNFDAEVFLQKGGLLKQFAALV